MQASTMESTSPVDNVDSLDLTQRMPFSEFYVNRYVLFPKLELAGFKIETKDDENPWDVLKPIFEELRESSDGEQKAIAELLRNCGHAQLIPHLYSDLSAATATDICSLFPKINVIVKPAEQIFPPDDKVYNMSSQMKGLAFILNNFKFAGDHTRLGSKRDFDYMIALFSGLGYSVIYKENLTAQEMKNVLFNFSKHPDLKSADSCVVVIMSHGQKRHKILGIDENWLDLDYDITPLFNNLNCPNLQNKPKMFFIQACRGDSRDSGIDVVDVVDAKTFGKSNDQISRYPSWSDMAIIHSTVPGYVSNRHGCEGSWFVKSLVEILMDHAYDTDLETMIKMVVSSVMKRQSQDFEMQAPEAIYRGWRKSLYFNPVGTPLDAETPTELDEFKSDLS